MNGERETKIFLEWAIPTEAVKHMQSFPKDLIDEPYVYACLSTLAMGDGAACEFAQTSHLALAVQAGVQQTQPCHNSWIYTTRQFPWRHYDR